MGFPGQTPVFKSRKTGFALKRLGHCCWQFQFMSTWAMTGWDHLQELGHSNKIASSCSESTPCGSARSDIDIAGTQTGSSISLRTVWSNCFGLGSRRTKANHRAAARAGAAIAVLHTEMYLLTALPVTKHNSPSYTCSILPTSLCQCLDLPTQAFYTHWIAAAVHYDTCCRKLVLALHEPSGQTIGKVEYL